MHRELMDEWRRAERTALEFGQQALTWLAAFYVDAAGSYRISYIAGDRIPTSGSPNTATCHIGLIAREYVPNLLSKSERRTWESVGKQVDTAWEQLNKAGFADGLPLRNFGVLSLFATCFRCAFLGNSAAALRDRKYGVMMRRILYEMWRQQAPQVAYSQRTDSLHPYLVFNCARSILQLAGLLAPGVDPGDAQFFRTTALFDFEDLWTDTKIDRREFDLVLGTGDDDEQFRNDFLSHVVGSDNQAGQTIKLSRQWLEHAARNSALAEIEQSKSSGGAKEDVSSLAFALQALSLLNFARHEQLILEGINTVLESSSDAFFPASKPFNIDSMGRALFPPSIEIANAILSIVLSHVDRIPDERIEWILGKTKALQSSLVAGHKRIEIFKDKESSDLFGWCSDRAPSSHRVDSWITGEAAVFFFKHLELIRAAKRRRILAEYNWIPHNQLTVDWKDIIDPDLNLTEPGPKKMIEEVITRSRASDGRAPVFLLYGPPGTSKTTLVYGAAKLMKWDLVTLSPSDFIHESFDRIENRSRKIFDDLTNLDQCVILLDEVDSLLRERETLRNGTGGNIMEFVVPALLPKIQKLRDYTLDRNVAVFFASNFYERIDRALSRSGRIDNHILVLPYGKDAQKQVVRQIAGRSSTNSKDILQVLDDLLAKFPCAFVYRDLERLLQAAIADPDPASLEQLARSLGIQPDAYDTRHRRNANRELVSFIHRLQNKKMDPQAFLWDAPKVVGFLKESYFALKDSRWAGSLDNWRGTIEAAKEVY